MADLSSGLPKEAVQQKRDNLLFAIQIPDTALTDTCIKALQQGYEPQYALDNYELLQIYLLQGRYSRAMEVMTQEFAKGDSLVRYSVVPNDTLIRFLDARVNLTDSLFIRSQVARAHESIVDTQLHELTGIMLNMLPFYKITSKAQILSRKKHPAHNKIYEKRFRAELPYYRWVNEEKEDTIVTALDTFEIDHPESKYGYFIDAVRKRIGGHLEEYRNWIDPSSKKAYTSSIGFEFLYGLDQSYYIGFPLQYKRLIFTPALGNAENEVDGQILQATLGLVLLDVRYFKFYPLVGYGPFAYFGGQVDFRAISERGFDTKFGFQGYIALKARYTIEWVPGKGFDHLLFFGIGGHLW